MTLSDFATLQTIDMEKGLTQQQQEALADLYTQYAKRITSYAFKIVHCWSKSQDVCQDAILYVAKYAKNFNAKSPEHIESWLMKVARNTALQTFRKKQPESLPYDIGR